MNRLALIGICLMFCASAYADEQIFRTDGAVVYYNGISAEYAEAIAKTTASARDAAAEIWGFDMPRTVIVKVDARSGQRARLFNDGQDRLFLV